MDAATPRGLRDGHPAIRANQWIGFSRQRSKVSVPQPYLLNDLKLPCDAGVQTLEPRRCPSCVPEGSVRICAHALKITLLADVKSVELVNPLGKHRIAQIGTADVTAHRTAEPTAICINKQKTGNRDDIGMIRAISAQKVPFSVPPDHIGRQLVCRHVCIAVTCADHFGGSLH